MSAVLLALPLALGGCLKGALPPSLNPPEWTGVTVNFSSVFTPPAGPWVTTVSVPQCLDSGNASVDPVVTVSNGSVSGGGGVYTWTRAPGALPTQALSGTFTADCIDYQGLHAHPVLAVTAAALP
ncbi:MAG: hypothetical protein ACT4PI_14660 [Actinomycetota bacterium]